MQRILILGGHGFIGHHAAQILTNSGHSVAIVDIHHSYGEYPEWEMSEVIKQRIEYMGKHTQYIGDTSDREFMDRSFAEFKPTIVIDLATYPNAKMVKKNVVDATNNMVSATAVALELCAKYGVSRFVIASSSMAYGDFEAFDGPPTEDCVCNPLTLYGSYKLQGERMCRIWFKEHGLEYAILRPSALYGTRDMVVRAISKMTLGALKEGKIVVQGATNKLDFSCVTDVASAFVHAALSPHAKNEVFNCTRGNGRTILEAAEIIASIIPAEIITMPHDAFYPNRDTLNSNKLREVTGWKPTVDIEQGIPEYINWFLAQPYVNKF